MHCLRAPSARLLQQGVRAAWKPLGGSLLSQVDAFQTSSMLQQPTVLSNFQKPQETLLKQQEGLKPVICYHYPCIDGVFAALAASLYYQQQQPTITPRFRPFTVYDAVTPADLGLQGDEVVYFLDYSGPAGLVQQVAPHCRSVIVLDHHKTALEQLSDIDSLPPNVHVLLDMERSGATIARDYFRPSLSPDLQTIYGYVEDADLWRWRLPGSRAFHAGVSAFSMDFSAATPQAAAAVFGALEQLKPEAVVTQGEEILKQQQLANDAAVAAAHVLQLGGAEGEAKGWGTCLGCEVTGDLIRWRSSLGNQLALASKAKGLMPVGVVAYVEPGMSDKEHTIKVSLRAVDNFDTTPISEAYGGGGHKAASSCLMPRQQYEQWRGGASGGS